MRDVAARVGIAVSDQGKDVSAQRKQQAASAGAGRQPRGARLPAIIPEFKEMTRHDLWDEHVQRFQVHAGTKTGHHLEELFGIPIGSKILAVDAIHGKGRSTVRCGIYHTHAEFEQRMSRLHHPYDGKGAVEDDTLRAIFELLTEGPAEIRRRKEVAFEAFEKRVKETKEQDDNIRAAMSPERAHITKDRAFTVFREMCKAAGVQDKWLHELHVVGSEFTGVAKDSEEFASQAKPAPMSTEQVQGASKWTRRRALDQPVPSTPSELDIAVWRKTEEEIAEKWLRGPVSEKELLDEFGPRAVVARRF